MTLINNNQHAQRSNRANWKTFTLDQCKIKLIITLKRQLDQNKIGSLKKKKANALQIPVEMTTSKTLLFI